MSHDDDRGLQLSAINSEFALLRTEIGRLIDHQKDLHNIAFVALGALLAFIGVLVQETGDPERLLLVLLVVPLLTLQFALTASDLSRRILQLGDYLGKLSKDANQLIGAGAETRVWDWERWKATNYKENNSKHKKVGILVLEKSRWIALASPGIVAICAYWALDPTPCGSGLEVTLLIASGFVLAFSVFLLVAYRSEAKGVSLATDEPTDEPVAPPPAASPSRSRQRTRDESAG